MYGEYDDYTPCPFGKEYKGERLKDVPWDFLMWWFNQNRDRAAIIEEMDDPVVPWPRRKAAVKKLRLYDYMKSKIASEPHERDSSYSSGHVETRWQSRAAQA